MDSSIWNYNRKQSTVSDGGNGWTKVSIDFDDLYYSSCADTFAIRFYNASVAGTFLIKDLYISNAEVAPATNYRGVQFYYNKNFNKEISAADYKIVEFDYLMLNDQSFRVALLSPDWSKYYGYFTFDSNGPTSNYAGIQYEALSDGYIHVTMVCSQLSITNNNSNRDNVPATFDKFYIRGGSGIGLVDNFNFSMDDSHIVTYRGERFNLGVDYNDGTINVAINRTLNIDFYFLSENDTYIELILGLDWQNWFGYYRIYADGHLGGNYQGVTTGDCADGYHRVSFDLTNLGSYGANTQSITSLKLFHISSSRSNAEGFVDFNASGEATMYRGEMFTAGTDLTINKSPVACSTIEFDYLIKDDGFIKICFLDENWAKYYGYYQFNKTGAASNYVGVSTQALSDGYIHVVLICLQLQITNNNSNRDNAPDSISVIYIRGDFSTANGYIDNLTLN